LLVVLAPTVADTVHECSRSYPSTDKQDDARDEFDVDSGCVVRSGSFRRLQGKTQILNLRDSDFYRTRMTHSLDVAQIAGGVMRQRAKTCSDSLCLRERCRTARSDLPSCPAIRKISVWR
jgi:dGTP triphosphohydrolase